MAGTAVRVFRSTDTGAPVLSGTLGSLTALFDACLVAGYNSKTITSITRVGQTATATCNAHGFPVDGLAAINLSGAGQPEYVGDFTIFNVTTNTFDFTVVGSPATPATGTITGKVAPAGWAKPFTGTNKAVFRSQEVTGTRMYLRVDDNNPITDTNQSAVLRGYETMTDVDSGTGLFPTVAQMVSGIFLAKSSTSSAVARPWYLFADGFEFIIFYTPSASYPSIGMKSFHFGDFATEMYSDPYGCLIYGDYSSGNFSTPENGSYSHNWSTSLSVSQSGHYVARSYNQIGTSVAACKLSDFVLNGTSVTFGQGSMLYPAPHNNGLYIAPVYIGEPSPVIRGSLKCIYAPLHTRPLGHAGTVSNLSNLPGRTLFSIATAYTTYPACGETFVDITGPWR